MPATVGTRQAFDGFHRLVMHGAHTGSMQQRCACPTSGTVQAPHWLTPQPNFVPTKSRCSRSTANKDSFRPDARDVDALAAHEEVYGGARWDWRWRTASADASKVRAMFTAGVYWGVGNVLG